MNQSEFEVLYAAYQLSNGQDEGIKKALEPYKVKNAVIMAAGMSNRFVPLSFEKPKGLLDVKGEKLIEREIRQLKEAGIEDITVVVGYMKESFMYLKEAFGVDIVVNNDFHRYNNTSTLMCVLDRLDNTYICSSDNYFSENPFEPYVNRAYYAAIYGAGETNEYCLQTDDDGLITDVAIGGRDSWYMLGHVYFDRDFSHRFAQILQAEYPHPEIKSQLWENMYIRRMRDLPLYIRKYPDGMIYEFDTLEELRAFDETYRIDARSGILRFICKQLHCTEESVTKLAFIESEKDVQAFRFEVKDNSYLYVQSRLNGDCPEALLKSIRTGEKPAQVRLCAKRETDEHVLQCLYLILS